MNPSKKNQGQDHLDAADPLFSTAISRIRQPIESLFAWIEQKTGIALASQVRSYAGLMVHVFGRLAATFFGATHELALNSHLMAVILRVS
ncbi:MAG: transposase [Thioploca sp.]|nr:transposase [Thioploca sp.]